MEHMCHGCAVDSAANKWRPWADGPKEDVVAGHPMTWLVSGQLEGFHRSGCGQRSVVVPDYGGPFVVCSSADAGSVAGAERRVVVGCNCSNCSLSELEAGLVCCWTQSCRSAIDDDRR